jgi:2-phosphoglycolate phosphatase
MKRHVDLVMFDLDGTLADTGRDLAGAVNYTRAYFSLGPLANEIVYSKIGRGIEYLLRHTLPDDSHLHFQEVMRVFLKRYEDHLLDTTVLYPNVQETLEFFQNKKRVVVSNKIARFTVSVLRGLGVEKQFDAILGGDSVTDKKPHPALLNKALARFNIAATKAVMIGDGDIDVEAGKRAGVVTCGVTYGLGNKEDLAAAKPDFLIDHLSELPGYFY